MTAIKPCSVLTSSRLSCCSVALDTVDVLSGAMAASSRAAPAVKLVAALLSGVKSSTPMHACESAYCLMSLTCSLMRCA